MPCAVYVLIIQALVKDNPDMLGQLSENIIIPTPMHGKISLLEFAIIHRAVKIIQKIVTSPHNRVSLEAYKRAQRLYEHATAPDSKEKELGKIEKIFECIEQNSTFRL